MLFVRSSLDCWLLLACMHASTVFGNSTSAFFHRRTKYESLIHLDIIESTTSKSESLIKDLSVLLICLDLDMILIQYYRVESLPEATAKSKRYPSESEFAVWQTDRWRSIVSALEHSDWSLSCREKGRRAKVSNLCFGTYSSNPTRFYGFLQHPCRRTLFFCFLEDD